MKTAVLGSGSWGTAFSKLTAESGHPTALWSRTEEKASQLRENRTNPAYLPGVPLPHKQLKITSDIGEAAEGAELICFAIPSFAVRKVARRLHNSLENRSCRLLNLAKGVEEGTFKTMSEVIAEECKGPQVFTLSGPSHAEEVASNYPTAVVLAGELEVGRKLQQNLSTERFRLYLSSDQRGVEYCGAVKNIIAIATGIATGMGYGDNTTGALISRGLAEMVRFGTSMGASKETFFGLAGVGDLVATCTSDHSRNRTVGKHLGQGKSIREIRASMNMVAEGLYTVDSVYQMSQKRNISMPITAAVNRIVKEESNPGEEVEKMMTREFKVEDI